MPLATYDTANKLVILDQVAPTAGAVELTVIGLYSDAKQQWKDDLSLNRFVFPWIAIGGQPLPGGAIAPRIYFLRDPWQMRPYEADHDLTLRTNLFTENGIPLMVPTIGNFTVNANTVSEIASGDDRIQEILNILSVMAAPTAIEIADEVLKRDVSNTEATAGVNSLTALILAAFHAAISTDKLTIRRTDDATLFDEKSVVLNPRDPVEEISE